MSTAEETIVQRLRQGQSAALTEFLSLRRPALLAYIERNLGDALRSKLEPEDLFQELSIHALRAVPTTDFSALDPFGWLCHLAKQRIIDAHRRLFGAQKRAAGREVPLGTPGAGSSQPGLIDLLVVSMTTPSQAMSRDQRQERLQEALAALPADSREALRLRYVEAMPSKEIAERLGKTDGAVRVLLTRSLSRLQQLLGPDAAP